MLKPNVYTFLLLFVVFASRTFAQNYASLSSTNGKVFRLYVDGKAVNAAMQAQVQIRDIRKDTLAVELEFENRKRLPATLYLLEKGVACRNKEFSYKVDFDDMALKVIFMSVYDIVPLPEPLVPKQPVKDTSINFKNVLFQNFCEIKDGRPVYYNNTPKSGTCTEAMPEKYMDYATLLISKTETPDQKFTIVENVCRNNCVSTAQLSRLLAHIDYEIEKLKMIRIAYPTLVDVSNKNELRKNFRFESSTHELNAILNTPQTLSRSTALCDKPASDMLINSLVERLANYTNDGERIELMRKTYSQLCYSVEQSTLILNAFTHDREKLDVAKLLYLNCVKKETFMTVAEVFSYKQTVSELQDFVDKQGR